MIQKILTISILVSATLFVGFRHTDSVNEEMNQRIQQIVRETQSGQAFHLLEDLVKGGPRLSGSAGAEQAVKWAQARFQNFGFDQVKLQKVTVPRWERGATEKAQVILENESQVSLQVAALGGSVGTPAQGITAQVIEVQSLQEAQKLGARARGKIIFYNRPLAPSPVDPFEAYSGAIDQRISGAIVAAKMGAAASIIRSLSTLPDDDHPHTGSMGYSHSVTKIPAAALSTHGANQLSSLLKKSPDLKLRLQLSAQRLPSVESYNVMAEITGSEYPNQIVLVGGHLDSWDLSPGAHDNGTGVAHSIEVLRAIQAAGTRLNFKPKRTIRAVLFMSEEWGGIGSEEYARQAQSSGERHIAAIESDRGGFAPVGFSVGKENKGASRLVERFKSWNAFLSHTRGSKTVLGFSGTDVEPLAKLGCATIGFLPEATHYFDLHHSALDQLGAVQASDLSEGAAAMASLAYLISEYGL